MRRVSLTLLLLATFSLGLVAGAHPCQAAHGRAQAWEEGPASQPSSCHAGMSQRSPTGANGPSVRAGAPARGERNCCEIACQHACHLVAVVSFQRVMFPAALISQRFVEPAGRDLSLFAGGIDHIPLL